MPATTLGFPKIQELCDHVVDFLASTTDLKSCALVSPAFTASAQRHLFREVSMSFANTDGFPVYRQSTACHRFCALMQESPHLLPLVRRLRADFTEGMLTMLNTVKFPNLREILLEHNGNRLEPDPASISAAAVLISLPSLRRLALSTLDFRDLDDCRRLFALCTPRLDSVYLLSVTITSYPQKQPSRYPMNRVAVKRMKLERFGMEWLLDPCSPLDLSALSEFDGSDLDEPENITGILEGAPMTLTQLKVGAAQKPDILNAFDFTRLPFLSQLSISTSSLWWVLSSTELLLQSLPASNRIRVLTFEVGRSAVYPLPAGALRSLTTTLMAATLPVLQRLEVNVEAIGH
ncbi:hypothetical protein C8R43DRAFT_1137921 [Mycena crocata]|nr:hypothetical protein C8R43DRAFT_1137921 [Mycena crocata]